MTHRKEGKSKRRSSGTIQYNGERIIFVVRLIAVNDTLFDGRL